MFTLYPLELPDEDKDALQLIREHHVQRMGVTRLSMKDVVHLMIQDAAKRISQ